MKHKIRVFQNGKLVPLEADSYINPNTKVVSREIEVDGVKMTALFSEKNSEYEAVALLKAGRSPELAKRGIVPIRLENREEDNDGTRNK